MPNLGPKRSMRSIKLALAGSLLALPACGGYTNADQTPEQRDLRDSIDLCVSDYSMAVQTNTASSDDYTEKLTTVACAAIIGCETDQSTQRVLVDLSETNSRLGGVAITAIPDVEPLTKQYRLGQCSDITEHSFENGQVVSSPAKEALLPDVFIVEV